MTPTTAPTRLPRLGRAVVGAVVVVGAVAAVGAYAGAQAGESNDGAGPTPWAGAQSPTENVFVPITPCRIVNTQNPAGPIAAGATRTYRMHGNTSAQGGAASCGIPTNARALEVTVHAVSPAGTGYLRVFPAAGAEPNATFLSYTQGENESNTGTTAVTPGGGDNFRVRAYQAATHVIVDVAGYYVSELFAVVDSAGNLVRGNGVTGVVIAGTGARRVRFDRNVSGCAFSGGLHDAAAGYGSLGSIQMAGDSTNPNGIYLETRGTSGALADLEFHIIVDC